MGAYQWQSVYGAILRTQIRCYKGVKDKWNNTDAAHCNLLLGRAPKRIRFLTKIKGMDEILFYWFIHNRYIYIYIYIYIYEVHSISFQTFLYGHLQLT